MRGEDRKAAVASYRERKVASGIFVLRCQATGRQWVGQAPDLATIWNRVSFTLRHGSHPHPGLQAAWRLQAGEGFVFETLEQLDDEAVAYGRDRVLRARLLHWQAALGAERL